MINFYIKTALSGLKKNLKLYVPQIISSAVMFAIMYIMFSLCYEEALETSRGGRYIGIFMALGIVVISILSIVIIFYANNFLMRQRKREYGLYHVLGLEKKHIINIMLVENIISHAISILSGTLLGILFYRLATLVIFKAIPVPVKRYQAVSHVVRNDRSGNIIKLNIIIVPDHKNIITSLKKPVPDDARRL